MEKGIYYNLDESKHTLKLVGELRANDSNPLANMVSVFETNDNLGDLQIDLMATEFLDSTMLGVVGELGFLFMQNGNTKPIIYCQENDIEKMIDTMGLAQLFDIKHSPCPQAELDVLAQTKDASNLKEIIIRAHEMLIKIDPSNEGEFSDLLNQLRSKDTKGDE